MIFAHDVALGGFSAGAYKQRVRPDTKRRDMVDSRGAPRGERGEELQTFELFPTLKDARETQKIFEFGESCRPVPVEIKILA